MLGLTATIAGKIRHMRSGFVYVANTSQFTGHSRPSLSQSQGPGRSLPLDACTFVDLLAWPLGIARRNRGSSYRLPVGHMARSALVTAQGLLARACESLTAEAGPLSKLSALSTPITGGRAWPRCVMTRHPPFFAPGSRYPRSFSTSSSLEPLYFCVVGSGPAGMYAADKLLRRYGDFARVDIIERLPTPFGLVRTGVAPDHQESKAVLGQFSKIFADPRCSYFGNVRVGVDVSVSELRELYNVILLAYGAEADRDLGIPGESLSGVIPAREFVWWYNGHPEFSRPPVDLSAVRSVAVLGVGNVSLDIARLLLSNPAELAFTDMPSPVLEHFKKNSVEVVHLIGRRGPVQAAYTPKELREVLSLPEAVPEADAGSLALTEADREEMKTHRIRRRNYEVLSKAVFDAQQRAASGPVRRTSGAAPKRLVFRFLRSPVEIRQGAAGGKELVLEKTRLEPGQKGQEQRAVGTGETETLGVDLVLKSIGYKSVPVEGIPWDDRRSVARNVAGRVVEADGSPVAGMYVCGWLRRGPTGIIGTNLIDAEETVDVITDDVNNKRLPAVQAIQPGGAVRDARRIVAFLYCSAHMVDCWGMRVTVKVKAWTHKPSIDPHHPALLPALAGFVREAQGAPRAARFQGGLAGDRLGGGAARPEQRKGPREVYQHQADAGPGVLCVKVQGEQRRGRAVLE